jgi:hypothetical protein
MAYIKSSKRQRRLHNQLAITKHAARAAYRQLFMPLKHLNKGKYAKLRAFITETPEIQLIKKL